MTVPGPDPLSIAIVPRVANVRDFDLGRVSELEAL